MIHPNTKKLLNKVSEETEKGNLKWAESSSADQFLCTLPNGAVSIEHQNANLYDPGFLKESYVLSILNKIGEEIDFVKEDANSKNEDLQILVDLYLKASRMARKVDETIDLLLKDIDAASKGK